jgi:hypothetical protein
VPEWITAFMTSSETHSSTVSIVDSRSVRVAWMNRRAEGWSEMVVGEPEGGCEPMSAGPTETVSSVTSS